MASLSCPAVTRNYKVWMLVFCTMFMLFWIRRIVYQSPTEIRIQNWHDDTIDRSFLKDNYLNPQGRVVYNRVGKCGSRALVSLLKTLSKVNNFKVIGTMVNNRVALTTKEQMEFVNFVERLNPPFVYHQHIHYVDFQRFGGVQPVFINMIRDPIERFVSQYYFRRWGDERAEREFKGRSSTRNQTVDECVAASTAECTDPNHLFYTIPFFCGQRPSCRDHSRWALEQAKENVRTKYLAVGILEQFEEFLLVLEKLLPQQFGGILDFWNNPDPSTKTKIVQTQTRNKKLPSPTTRSFLRRKLDLEYEFYYFVRNQFESLKAELNMSSTRQSSRILQSKQNSPWRLEEKRRKEFHKWTAHNAKPKRHLIP